MENTELITWVLGVMAAVIGWLVISNVSQDRKLAIIETKLDSIKSTVELFLKTEMDTLKELVTKRSTQ